MTNDEGARMKSEVTRRFKRYPAYKDSGVEWLGEVPEHWEVAPATLATTSRLGRCSTQDE